MFYFSFAVTIALISYVLFLAKPLSSLPDDNIYAQHAAVTTALFCALIALLAPVFLVLIVVKSFREQLQEAIADELFRG